MVHVQDKLLGDVVVVGAGGFPHFSTPAVAPLKVALVKPRATPTATTTPNTAAVATVPSCAFYISRRPTTPTSALHPTAPQSLGLVLLLSGVQIPVCLGLGEELEVGR